MTSLVVTSPFAQGSNPATGRNVYVEGNRYVARFQITLPSSWTGAGVAFDPETYGFPYSPAEIKIEPHDVATHKAAPTCILSYDFANKKLCLWDATNSNTADGTDRHLDVYDLVFYSE